MRRKNVAFAVLGLVTPEKFNTAAPGAPTLEAFKIRSDPAVAVLEVQPEVEPSPVGCVNVAELTKPDGVVQAPLAVVHAVSETDFTTVADGAVKAKLYVVTALGAELPIVTLRVVSGAADAIAGTYIPIIAIAVTAATNLLVIEWMNFLDIVFPSVYFLLFYLNAIIAQA